MTTTYLVQAATATIAADGTATVTFRPDVGQFWAPSMVRVSTRVGPTTIPTFNPTVNASYCALFHGSSSPGSIDSTAFLDDTFKGQGDTSSVIAGTVVLFGEVIVVKWADAVPGVTAMAIVYGRTSDSLVELQGQLSPVPGAKFSGNNANALVWDYDADVAAGSPPNNRFLGAGPAITQRLFITPPNAVLELISITATITSDATVGTHIYGCQASAVSLAGADTLLFRTLTLPGQAAGNAEVYTWSSGVPSYVQGGIGASTIPAGIVLPPSSKVALISAGVLGATDAWTNWSTVYRLFNTLGKVTFT